MSKKHFFCFGLGYTGTALCELLLKEGWSVSGTCRTKIEQSALNSLGFNTCLFDGASSETKLLESLASASHLLSTVPPGESGDPILPFLEKHLKNTGGFSWVGYLSTTGVYGHRDGSWVNEDSETNPQSVRGLKRLAAEQAWTNLSKQYSLPLHIFRLSAIYGPGRNSLLRVLDGKARRIDRPGLFFSRIHLTDLIQVIRASIEASNPGRIYNVGDDLPTPPEEVIRFACELLNIEPPPLVPLEKCEMSDLAKSFYQDSKRVSNSRIKKELGVHLIYPDFKSGLTALFKNLNANRRSFPRQGGKKVPDKGSGN
ncbi:MAG: SDR family oxidoreductase [Candidatus Nitronauta litoralis]|uniref:SDR family oxidoreductase n=1 Tax=Candidatus Nitronauta litoralis TaxID=2705533 RepID=A0A7T0BX38_9BACT|nr:MAG: SDR family oxidoreductase [Candidatus Nitronauta litoralis]